MLYSLLRYGDITIRAALITIIGISLAKYWHQRIDKKNKLSK